MILDTHILLWVDRNDSKLGAMARLQIEAAWRAGLLVVSAISFWEATMLAERDRISLPTSPERWRANWLRAGLLEISIYLIAPWRKTLRRAFDLSGAGKGNYSSKNFPFLRVST